MSHAIEVFIKNWHISNGDNGIFNCISMVTLGAACKYILTNPLLISTGFLKYPLELKKKSVRTEKNAHIMSSFGHLIILLFRQFL